MPFLVDLHVHSFNSGDNNADPEEAVEQAILRGLHGLAFTEHYYYGVSEDVERLRPKYLNKIAIIRGVEFSSPEGHCLVFGVDTDGMNLKGAPVDELIARVNSAGGVVIPSHPFRMANSLGDRVRQLSGLCALEGYNGCNMVPMNERAVRTAAELGLPFTGGSDAHEPRDVGACYTLFEEPVTPENLIPQLKSGRYKGFDTRKVSRGIWG